MKYPVGLNCLLLCKHYGTLTICDATLRDVYVVLCYVLSQYRTDVPVQDELRIRIKYVILYILIYFMPGFC